MRMIGLMGLLLAVMLGCGASRAGYERQHALGLMAVQRSEFGQAEQHFREAIEYQDGPDARLDLARTLLVQEDLEQAEEQFKHFVAIEDEPRAYLSVFQAYFLLKHLEAARHWLTLGVSRHPGSAQLHGAFGELELSQDRFDAALVSFNKGLALAPRKLRDRFHVSVARAHLIKTVKLLSSVHPPAGADGGWQSLHQQMAQLARDGRLAILPAVLSLKRALYINPDNLQAHLLLGSVYHQLGRVEEAELEMEQAVRLAPNNGPAYYVLGTLRQARGNLALSIAAYRKAVQLAPGLREARAALAAALLDNGSGDEAMKQLSRIEPIAPGVDYLARAVRGSARAIDSLIDVLESSKVSAHRAHAAGLLSRLTGKKFGEDASRWRNWRRAQTGKSQGATGR